MMSEPLVSIGIPCYNRPEGLRRTLECITNQTYRNLEIIISDNCSPNTEVEVVGKEFVKKDSRVQYYRQVSNITSMPNFNFLLHKASGKYFMWAADDDIRKNFFVERCMHEFINNDKNYVAVTTEAQYFSEDGKLDFFVEGKPYYNFYSDNVNERLSFTLKYNYGNLIYSLFEKDALFEKNQSVFDVCGLKSLNEIPLFLIVMKHGNWKVIPEIGFLKNTNKKAYEYIEWEMKGGKLPNSSGFSYYKGLPDILIYHLRALKENKMVIDHLEIKDKYYVKKILYKSLLSHFCFFLIRYKTVEVNK